MTHQLLALVALIFTSTAAQAITLKCHNEFFKRDGGASYSAVVVDHMDAVCTDKAGKHYRTLFSGAGPSLGIAAESTFLMTCPGSQNIIGDYYGVKGSIGAIVGLHVGAVASRSGQVCFIIGGDTNVAQAGVVVDKIQVRERTLTAREQAELAYRARYNN